MGSVDAKQRVLEALTSKFSPSADRNHKIEKENLVCSEMMR